MKIPPVISMGRFVVPKCLSNLKKQLPAPPLSKDTVSFTASTAYYLKKYNTLPDEIKEILDPKDAIDMFKLMEQTQNGHPVTNIIGEGRCARVYDNPWLNGFHFLVVADSDDTTQIVYSRYPLGDSVWSDKDNASIQIIKAG